MQQIIWIASLVTAWYTLDSYWGIDIFLCEGYWGVWSIYIHLQWLVMIVGFFLCNGDWLSRGSKIVVVGAMCLPFAFFNYPPMVSPAEPYFRALVGALPIVVCAWGCVAPRDLIPWLIFNKTGSASSVRSRLIKPVGLWRVVGNWGWFPVVIIIGLCGWAEWLYGQGNLFTLGFLMIPGLFMPWVGIYAARIACRIANIRKIYYGIVGAYYLFFGFGLISGVLSDLHSLRACVYALSLIAITVLPLAVFAVSCAYYSRCRVLPPPYLPGLAQNAEMSGGEGLKG